MAGKSDFHQALDRLSGSMEKLQSALSGKGMGFGEALKNIRWEGVFGSKFQHGLQQKYGEDFPRTLKAGQQALGTALQLGGSLIGPGGLTGIADRGIKSSAKGALQGVGGFMSDLGGGLMATGNPMAAAAGGALKFAGAIAGIPAQIKEWADNLHESNRHFAEFSAGMAAVMAADDARRIGLEREQGERRSASARELSDARFRFDKAMSPIEDAFANLKNNVIAKLTDALSGMAETLSKLFPKGESSGEDNEILGFGGLNQAELDRIEKETQARRPKRLR